MLKDEMVCIQEPDVDADMSYLEQPEQRDRLAAYERGEFGYIGIQAAWCHGSLRVVSAGVWGVESDAGEDYLQELFKEEQEELLVQLRAMAQYIMQEGGQ